jgi:alkyl hydroperoxide reductase subunit AhpF
VININETFRGEQVLIDKVLSHPKITVVFSAETLRIEGERVVQQVIYREKARGTEHAVPTNGVFVHIGMIPNSSLVPAEVTKNAFREIEVNLKCETSVAGLFAAGDVTNIPYKQIAIAAGQGVTAGLSAIEYINKLA